MPSKHHIKTTAPSRWSWDDIVCYSMAHYFLIVRTIPQRKSQSIRLFPQLHRIS